jgi:G6PDH family F420-dependent oxidoreductase
VLFDVSLDPTDVAPGRLVEAARVAEQSGFDGVWVYDHISGTTLGGASIGDPWTLLGAVAGSTDRVSLGPLVTNATIRHPAHIAVAAATLQDLSGGRFVLGLGAGAGPRSPFSEEITMVGLEAESASVRRAKVYEAIEVIRRLWSGGGEFEGEHYSLRGAEGFAVPVPAPPIIVGANGPKMCRIAGALGDGVNLHSHEEDLGGLISVVMNAAPGRRPLVTVEAPMERRWIDGDAESEMSGLGVDRLILKWRGATDALTSIETAGERLAQR